MSLLTHLRKSVDELDGENASFFEDAAPNEQWRMFRISGAARGISTSKPRPETRVQHDHDDCPLRRPPGADVRLGRNSMISSTTYESTSCSSLTTEVLRHSVHREVFDIKLTRRTSTCGTYEEPRIHRRAQACEKKLGSTAGARWGDGTSPFSSGRISSTAETKERSKLSSRTTPRTS